MRISDELEKSLSKLEENSSDNILSLLDVASAFEKVYSYINTSLVSDEKDFYEESEDMWCKKERYDSVNGKTIYSVGKKGNESNIFNIVISNNGEINFELASEHKDEAEKMISKINEASNELLELIRMNCDISFFTENRELILSERPYLALKMGNFMEGDKAVLVYREEGNDTGINKTNSGLKYIRIDQIEGYLKNIKVDERSIPVLAFAYLGNDYSDELAKQKYYINESTYPKLTEDKVKKFTGERYWEKMVENALCIGLVGMVCLGMVGGFVGGVTALPFLPCLIAGTGSPILTAVVYYKNRCKQIERASQKDDLIENARLKTYKVLKRCANKNINYQEKELARKRNQNPMSLFGKKKGEKIDTAEVIRNVKTMISNGNSYAKPYYQISLAQILNAYTNTSSESRETELYDELVKLTDEISNCNHMELSEVIEMSIETVKRLSDKASIDDSLKCLNTIVSSIDKTSLSYSGIHKSDYSKELTRTYLELMLKAMISGEGLSIETLASINPTSRTKIVDYVRDFSTRVKYFDDINKSLSARKIYDICNSNEPTEVKIIKAVNHINENNLIHDLLGKELKDKSGKQKVIKTERKAIKVD